MGCPFQANVWPKVLTPPVAAAGLLFPPTPMAEEAPFDVADVFQPSPSCMPIIDPGLKEFGRLWIHAEHIGPGSAQAWTSDVTLKNFPERFPKGFKQCPDIQCER